MQAKQALFAWHLFMWHLFMWHLFMASLARNRVLPLPPARIHSFTMNLQLVTAVALVLLSNCSAPTTQVSMPVTGNLEISSKRERTADELEMLWPDRMAGLLAKSAGVSSGDMVLNSFFLGDNGFKPGGDAAALFDYNLRVTRRGSAYRDGHSQLSGSKIGTYADYDIEATIAFRSDLPVEVSQGCDYEIDLSAIAKTNKNEHYASTPKVTLSQGQPTTIKYTHQLALAEASHWLGNQTSSEVDGSIQFSLRFKSCKVVTHPGWQFPHIGMGGYVMDLRDYDGPQQLPSTEGYNNGLTETVILPSDLSKQRRDHEEAIAERVPGDQALAIGGLVLVGGAMAVGGEVLGKGLDKVGEIMAQGSSEGQSTTSNTRSNRQPSSEQARFAALFAGGYHRFTCTGDSAGGRQTGMTSYSITLKHSGTGKEWRVQYSVAQLFNRNSGHTGGLSLNDESLVGSTMEVRFNSKGEPESIKNLGNGNHCAVTEWWVTGYGW